MWQFDIDGTRRDLNESLKLALFSGNLGFGFVVLVSSLLAFLVFNRPCHARRAKIWLLAIVGILFWGALLSVSWRFGANPLDAPGFLPAFPVDVMHVLFLGLPLLWSIGLLGVAWTWREEEND